MEMLIITTESHQPLAKDWFRATMPASSGVTVKERQLDLVGDGTYESPDWQQALASKLQCSLEFMAGMEPGTIFSVSDVDIQFFPTFNAAAMAGLLEASGVDVLWQKEHTAKEDLYINPGFYVARNTEWFRDLLERALTLTDGLAVKNDQVALNQLLQPADIGTRWGFLPFTYYARSQKFPPGRDIVLHHANFSGSVPEKIEQLQRVRKYVTGGIVERATALGSEAVDFCRSGKLRLVVRTKLKRG